MSVQQKKNFAMNSLHKRLRLIESKRRVSLLPLVIFQRGATGLTFEQQARVDSARAIGRPVRIIKTVLV